MAAANPLENKIDAFCRQTPDDVQSFYHAIAEESRYGHYVRIPGRICRCLDYFKITHRRTAVMERLHSYYLFIGVVDDLIDSNGPQCGNQILEWLNNRTPSFDEATKQSRARLVTELLKSHISVETYPTMLAKLEELHGAVVRERKSMTMRTYIEHRKTVGRLTAEGCYLLIRPLLVNEQKALCGFLQKVGEIGCLIDSAIDLRADARLGLVSFKPKLKDYLELMNQLLQDGLKIALKHPRLSGLFLEAITDTLLDLRFRRADRVQSNSIEEKRRDRGYPSFRRSLADQLERLPRSIT
jgi:hypothetical protein